MQVCEDLRCLQVFYCTTPDVSVIGQPEREKLYIQDQQRE